MKIYGAWRFLKNYWREGTEYGVIEEARQATNRYSPNQHGRNLGLHHAVLPSHPRDFIEKQR